MTNNCTVVFRVRYSGTRFTGHGPAKYARYNVNNSIGSIRSKEEDFVYDSGRFWFCWIEIKPPLSFSPECNLNVSIFFSGKCDFDCSVDRIDDRIRRAFTTWKFPRNGNNLVSRTWPYVMPLSGFLLET